MSDNLSPEDRTRTMRAVKSQDTTPERKLFAMLAGMGLKGWVRHAQDLPGKPDVAFPVEHVAIFVDGCFWHGCPHCDRGMPKTNRDYWRRKIERNKERDQEHTQSLQADGWAVVRIWEHETRTPDGRANVRQRIRAAL